MLFVPASLAWGSAANVCSWGELGPGDASGGGTGTLKYGKSPTGIPHWRGSSTRARHCFPGVVLVAVRWALSPAGFRLYQAPLIFLQSILGGRGECLLLQALLLRWGDERITCPRFCHPSFKCRSRWLMLLHKRCPSSKSGIKVLLKWHVL